MPDKFFDELKKYNGEAFAKAFDEEVKGKKLTIEEGEANSQVIKADGKVILGVYGYDIYVLSFSNVTEIGDGFLLGKTTICFADVRNVKTIGNDFLRDAKDLRKLNAVSAEIWGENCLRNAEILEFLDLPSARKFGSGFISNAIRLKEVRLVQCGEDYIYCLHSCSTPRPEERKPKDAVLRDFFWEELFDKQNG